MKLLASGSTSELTLARSQCNTVQIPTALAHKRDCSQHKWNNHDEILSIIPDAFYTLRLQRRSLVRLIAPNTSRTLLLRTLHKPTVHSPTYVRYINHELWLPPSQDSPRSPGSCATRSGRTVFQVKPLRLAENWLHAS